MSDEKIVAVVAGIETLKKSVEASMSAGINEMRTESSRLKSIKDDVSATVRELKDVVKSGVSSIDKRHESYNEQQKKLFDLKQLYVICSFIIAVAIIAVISIHFYASSIKSDITKAKEELQTITEQKITVQNEINELWEGRTFSMKLGLKAREIDEVQGVVVPAYLKQRKLKDGSMFYYQ